MADKEFDPAQAAAEKLDKETKKVQEEQAKQFDMPRKNMPTENDMGPLPVKKPAKKYAKGGKVSQLAKANGIAVRGKSRGRII
jgi:hypothetical protein